MYTSQENRRVPTFVKLEKIGLENCYVLHFEFDSDYILPALNWSFLSYLCLIILDFRKHHFSMYFFLVS